MNFRVCATKDDLKRIEFICKNSGSERVKKTYSYISVAKWQSKEKFFAEILNDEAFYAGTFNKYHFNLIETAVLEEKQRNGLGTILVNRMKMRCNNKGMQYIRLRTSMSESAVDFWQKQGARITGYKDEDFVMEIDL